MRLMDPIFLTSARFDGKPAVEEQLLDAASGAGGRSLTHLVAAQPQEMLGDLGRAPPRIRLVRANLDGSVPSTAPVSLWTILEPGNAPGRYRAGERIRAYEGATVHLPAGTAALEISASFQPDNEGEPAPWIVRLPPVSGRCRATLFRSAAFSVETWTLPDFSKVVPNGETCHALVALTDGVSLDGRELPRGGAAFVPASGRTLSLYGAGARLLVAYPDQTPTAVWRHAPGPDPEASRIPLPVPRRPCITDTVVAPARLSLAAA